MSQSEESVGGPSSAPGGAGPGIRLVLVAAVALVAIVAAAGFALAWQHDRSALRTADRQAALFQAARAAEAAARTAAVQMTTYDYTSLDHDFGWVNDAGTAAFRKQYAEVSAPIRKLVLEMKARAVGSVIASAADPQDPDHVTVLLFVDQTLSNASQSGKGLDQPRVTMKMVRTGGRWLVDEVSLNSLPGH